jgi:hypothetical protein
MKGATPGSAARAAIHLFRLNCSRKQCNTIRTATVSFRSKLFDEGKQRLRKTKGWRSIGVAEGSAFKVGTVALSEIDWEEPRKYITRREKVLGLTTTPGGQSGSSDWRRPSTVLLWFSSEGQAMNGQTTFCPNPT